MVKLNVAWSWDMKVGIFSDVFYPYLAGGGENRYYQLAKHLVASGDEVVVITSNLSGCSSYETLFDGRLRIHRVGFPPHPTSRRSILGIPGYFLSSVLKARLVNECDVLDLNTYASALAGKIVSRLKKKPSIVTVHDLFTGQWSSGHNLVVSILGSMSEKLIGLVNSEGPFITVSESTKRKMIHYLGLDEKSILVIPNGVDFDGIRKIALGTRRESNRIVYVGRLIGYKKVEQVLELVLRLRRLGLNVGADIVGDGPERMPLESLASKMGVADSVRFWGFLKRYEDVARIVSSGTVFVNPSIFEGFGLTLLEAMAAGTPVVAYDLESYREYARDGVNCLLARPYDFEEFTDNVKRIIVDETVANGISRMGIETASQFGWAKMAQRMRDIYLSVAS